MKLDISVVSYSSYLGAQSGQTILMAPPNTSGIEKHSHTTWLEEGEGTLLVNIANTYPPLLQEAPQIVSFPMILWVSMQLLHTYGCVHMLWKKSSLPISVTLSWALTKGFM